MRERGFWQSDRIVSYVIDCYEGVEMVDFNGVTKPVRQFMWADADGEVWIGNSAAFAEHMAERFGYEPKTYDYVSINSLLIDMGERVYERRERTQTGEKAGQKPLQPQKHRA